MKVYCSECKHHKDLSNRALWDCYHPDNIRMIENQSVVYREFDHYAGVRPQYTMYIRNKDNACPDFEKKTQSLWQRIKEVLR